LDPTQFHTGHHILRRALESLRAAGLVEFEDERRHRNNFEIRVSEHWDKIQGALDISLAGLAKYDPRRSMTVEPFFGPPKESSTIADVFVLMPFAPHLRPVYEDHIKRVVTELGLSVARADDFFTAHSIMADVWSAICGARLLIADCTQRNPNVFYEIGLAHVLGKPVILITQDSNDVPFDVRHLRYIQYEYTPRGMKNFEDALAKTIKTTLSLDGDLEE
jgi:hypothetical protein